MVQTSPPQGHVAVLKVSILVEDRAPLEPMWQVAMARVTETEKEIVAVSL